MRGMKTSIAFIASVLFFFAFAPSSGGALPLPNTQWEGVIAAIDAKSVAVQNPKGTKVFAVYPGTVFGQGASKKVSDFKVGDKVLVVFSTSGSQTKAENIRNPDQDRKPAKKNGKGPKKQK